MTWCYMAIVIIYLYVASVHINGHVLCFCFFFAQKVCNAIEWSLPFTAGKQERKLKNKQKAFFFNKSKNRSSLDLMHAH